MSNVDYLHVAAPPADVMAAVKAATGITELVDGDTLVNGDECTALTIAPSVDDGKATVIDVYYGGELADRRAISRRIYDHIVEHTAWDVELDSDDAADIIASRVTAHA